MKRILFLSVFLSVNAWAGIAGTTVTLSTSQFGTTCNNGVIERKFTGVCPSAWTAGALSSGSGDWQLSATNYTAAKMPMTVIYPRPDAETATWAHHRLAYPGLEHKFPIDIQGGAWPLHYEIISGPVGVTVGEWLVVSGDTLVPDDSYGVVTWSNPVAGSHPLTVRVTDQQGATVDISTTIVVSTANHIFVDANASSSGDGTISSPLQDIDDWYLSDYTDSTYAGTKVWYRAGTYTVDNFDTGLNSLQLNAGKPLVHIAYPGETVVHDMSASRYITSSASDAASDLYFGGIQIANTNAQTYANAHGFWVVGVQHRMMWYDLDFHNLGRGTTGNDNPAGVFTSAEAAQRNYIAMNRCKTSGTNTAALLDFYGIDYWTVTYSDLADYSGSEQMILPKSGMRYGSLRHNTYTQASYTPGYGIIDLLNQADPVVSDEIEVAYNTLLMSDSTSRAIIINWSGGGSGGDSNHYVYRNTVIGRIDGLDVSHTVDIERNVVISSHSTPIAQSTASRTINSVDNLVSSTASGYINSSGALLGTSRDNYLGIRGAEIAQ